MQPCFACIQLDSNTVDGMPEQVHSIGNALNKNPYRIALWHLGFRPFFLGAMVFAVVAMLFWLLLLLPVAADSLVRISPRDWHAHEMIYGYGVAVIAGFLLTAIRNWTGIQTVHGVMLFGLFLLWAAARLMPFIPIETNLQVMAGLDVLFLFALLLAAFIPIARVKQWSQLGIVLNVVLLLGGNVLFYLGVLQLLEQGRITSQEAAELIAALRGAPPPGQEDEPGGAP